MMLRDPFSENTKAQANLHTTEIKTILLLKEFL